MVSPRTLVLLAIPAIGIGAIAGLVFSGREPEPDAPVVIAGGTNPVPDDARSHDRPTTAAHPRPPKRVRDPSAPGAFVPLDPSFVARIDSADEATRLACAADLLRMGPSRVASIEALPATTDAGRALRDAVANALDKLAQVRRGEDFPRLPLESRLEVELKFFGEVVPPELLRAERRKFWQERVAADPPRVATGAIPEGQAAWHQLELAKVRLENGEIRETEYAALRDEKLPMAREWLASITARPEVGRDTVERITKAIERLGR